MTERRSPRVSLAEIKRRLGATLLTFEHALPAQPREVAAVVLEHSEDGVPQGALVLANASSGPDFPALLESLASAGAAGVVLRPGAEVPAALLKRAGEWRLAVAFLTAGASWLQLAAVLQSMVGPRMEDSPGLMDVETAPDLFDVANSLASILGGPVTIENMTSRILAFSADQAQADEARQRSVLGHQVPTEYEQLLRVRGDFKSLYASEAPCFFGSIGPGIRGRVGLRVKAGRELLGSIWVVSDEPLDEHRARAMVEGADMIALSMLRNRTAADAAARLRAGLLIMLLEGGAAAEEAAARIGFSGAPTAVLALASAAGEGDDAAAEAAMNRLAGALVLHLRAVHPLSVAGVVGRTVYGVLPIKTADGAERLVQIAKTLLDRLGQKEPLVIGLGSVQPRAGRLNSSRADADRALRVLCHRYRPGDGREAGTADPRARIATSAEVQVESLMIRLGDQLAAGGEPLAGPLATLKESDTLAGTDYVSTLAAWLDAFGDVSAAARVCSIHQNTLRYRLSKISELAGVDLGSPQQRFELMLQLRLFELQTGLPEL